MRHDNFIYDPTLQFWSRGRLAHWRRDNAVYSITFRLADSLPRNVALALARRRDELLRNVATAVERVQLDAIFASEFDMHLDGGYGSCILRDERNARIVAESLQHFDRSRYELHAWCVMPNHVHVLLYITRSVELPRILHSWKSYTAHAIGRGSIWQREYFDRLVRGADDFRACRDYIRANPAKAGLDAWPWTG